MINSLTIANQVVLPSIIAGFLSGLISILTDEKFWSIPEEKNSDFKRLLGNAIRTGTGYGLLTGVSALAVVSCDPYSLEDYNFIDVFLFVLFATSSQIWLNVFKLIRTKLLITSSDR